MQAMQGRNMSTSLLKLYLSVLAKEFIEERTTPIVIGTSVVGSLMYADDIIFLSQEATSSQHSLNNLHNYCRKWKINVNIRNTKVMVFYSRKVQHTFRRGVKAIQHSDRICYLGLILRPSGKFRATVKYLYDKANRASLY